MCSCADPKAPNEHNFTSAINAAIGDSLVLKMKSVDGEDLVNSRGDRYFKNVLNSGDDPVVRADNKTFNADYNDQQNTVIADLVNAGILIPYATDVCLGRNLFGRADLYFLRKKEYSTEVRGETISEYFFCYGKKAVDNIIQWTDPGDMMGVTIIYVKYIEKISDSPKWAKNIIDYYNQKNRQERSITLALTNKRWSAQ